MAGKGHELPQECIEEVVSRVGHMDACRLSAGSYRLLNPTSSGTDFCPLIINNYVIDEICLQERVILLAPWLFVCATFNLITFITMISSLLVVEECFWLSKRTSKKCFLSAVSFIGDIEEVYFEDHGWSRPKADIQVQAFFLLHIYASYLFKNPAP